MNVIKKVVQQNLSLLAWLTIWVAVIERWLLWRSVYCMKFWHLELELRRKEVATSRLWSLSYAGSTCICMYCNSKNIRSHTHSAQFKTVSKMNKITVEIIQDIDGYRICIYRTPTTSREDAVQLHVQCHVFNSTSEGVENGSSIDTLQITVPEMSMQSIVVARTVAPEQETNNLASAEMVLPAITSWNCNMYMYWSADSC